jgi:1,4-alpha-glucan branching enzyme
VDAALKRLEGLAKMKIKNAAKGATKKVVTTKKTVVKTAAKKVAKVADTKKSVTFTLHAEKGKAVYVAGQFNEWDPTAKAMAYKAKEGIYTATIKLAPGTYEYKYVIDGAWCADPENVEAVPNDQGTFNSVITVK